MYDDEAAPEDNSNFDDSFRYGESGDDNDEDDANKIEVNMDDLEDEQEDLLNYQPGGSDSTPKVSSGETGGLISTAPKTESEQSAEL